MKILLTGADGFLGWHTRSRLHALTDHQVVAVGRGRWAELATHSRGVNAIIHMAGVNRANANEVAQANIELALDVAQAARSAGSSPRIVYANSIQAGGDSPYGVGKSRASEVLAAAATEMGSAYVDVRLPNLFGEHGRHHYNSFVATFVNAVIEGEKPQIADRPVDLLHVQGAASELIEALSTPKKGLDPAGTTTTVQGVFDTLQQFNGLYASGDIPPLLTDLDIDLFNTLRTARFPEHYPIALTPRTDNRGRLVEVVRAHGGQGQTFVSTTKPGITRGEHFHLRKVERFVVLSGEGRISLRRLFHDDIVSFDVNGQSPTILDMPTMWVHNITNTGTRELTTLFWTHELFDPAAPDTFPEPVGPHVAAVAV